MRARAYCCKRVYVNGRRALTECKLKIAWRRALRAPASVLVHRRRKRGYGVQFSSFCHQALKVITCALCCVAAFQAITCASCCIVVFLYLTFDDSFIARRALFVKYFFTEIENKLVYVNIDGAHVICYCVFIDAAREFPGCVLRKRGGEAWFLAFRARICFQRPAKS